MDDVFAVGLENNSEVVHASFTIEFARDDMLLALRKIGGVIEQSQVLQILSHIKLTAKDSTLSLVATDSEVEMTTSMPLTSRHNDSVSASLPGRKALDICKSLPSGSSVKIVFEGGWAKVIGSNGVEFTLAALPSSGFPVMRMSSNATDYCIKEADLSVLFASTAFAMAHHDVRHFLNGMLLSFDQEKLKATTTDGHRLALGVVGFAKEVSGSVSSILPRKSVLELVRLLGSSDDEVNITLTDQHAVFSSKEFTLSTRVLEGDYPDCERLIPKVGGNAATISKDAFKQALVRAQVLAKEKYHGVRLAFSEGCLMVSSNNADNEKTKEKIALSYSGPEMHIAFNISYLLDVVNTIHSDSVIITLYDSQKSILISASCSAGVDEGAKYVVMPMTL